MVKRQDIKGKDDDSTFLVIPIVDAAVRLNERIELGNQLLKNHVATIESFERVKNSYEKWHSKNAEILERIFSTAELSSKYFLGGLQERKYASDVFALNSKFDHLNKKIKDSIDCLKLLFTSLIAYANNESNYEPRVDVNTSEPRLHRSNKVFIVHGHDELARETTARFIERLGLEAIILQEQANGGDTIINKFEKNSDVEFAVVLLTPDDVGCAINEQPKYKPRVRQNVVFELGYFVAKLRRHKLAALIKGDVEMPTDYSGVAYINMDSDGAWKMKLANEFEKAGLKIDHKGILS